MRRPGTNVDPRTAGARPHYPLQHQEPTAADHRMEPRPDYGAESYRGTGGCATGLR